LNKPSLQAKERNCIVTMHHDLTAR
jgi:hypothetical protein